MVDGVTIANVNMFYGVQADEWNKHAQNNSLY